MHTTHTTLDLSDTEIFDLCAAFVIVLPPELTFLVSLRVDDEEAHREPAS